MVPSRSPRSAAGRSFARLFFLTILLLLSSRADAAKTTDTLYTLNGDRFVGEIKELDVGKLLFYTDATGKFEVKWEYVVFLKSPRYFRVELENGLLYFGSLDFDTTRTKLVVMLGDKKREMDLIDVVTITRIRETFWDRVDGSVSLGFSFTQASEVGTLSLAGDATHIRDLDYRKVNLNLVNTFRKDANPAQKQDLNFLSAWYLRNQWFGTGFAGYERNTELGLQARYSLGGGAGRWLIQSNRERFMVLAALVVNWEGGRDENQFNLESTVGTQYSLFSYEFPKINLSTGLRVTPSLTNFGRIRSDFDIKLKWEIIKNLTWELSAYYSYDSQPATEGANRHDYGVTVLSLGFSF
jgi:hypothetical protein